jgi:integrative and conjugative element protein (TIGR02256 family)
MCQSAVIWFPAVLYDHCVEQARSFGRLETGGAFMGYWRDQAAVITAAIDAGPNALHEPYQFEPDQDWQLAEIARHYEASGRRETYIGDWHTHPGARAGYLSRTDRAVLRRIINTPAARAERPAMIVFHGVDDVWDATAWLACLRPRRFLWPRLQLDQIEQRTYGS